MAEIVVFGSLNYDILFEVDRLPVPGETRAALSTAFHGGGKGANQAVQAALLGAEVELIGAVGKDTLGGDLAGRLEAAGVGTRALWRVDAPTGVGVVSFLEDGTVAATIGRGANWALSRDDVDGAAWLWDGAKVALFQLENDPEIVTYAAAAARVRGCRIVLNAAPAAPISDKLRALVDLLVVNEVEAGVYCGRDVSPTPEGIAIAGQKLVSVFEASVVITVGAEGSWVFEKPTGAESEAVSGVHIPARIVRAVETTGAGDSYIGAMAVMLAKGGSLVDAAGYGTRASSVTIQSVGAQGAMPDRARLEACD